MNALRRLDDQLLADVDGFARHTGWLHGAVLGYATYGLVLFGALLLAGLWLTHTRTDRALAAAAGLWLVSRVLGALATAAALGMAFARVYIAAHYPWDVLAGLVLGALVTLLGWLLLRSLLTVTTGWLRRQPGVRQVFPAPAALPTRREPPGRRATAA